MSDSPCGRAPSHEVVFYQGMVLRVGGVLGCPLGLGAAPGQLELIDQFVTGYYLSVQCAYRYSDLYRHYLVISG